MKPKFLPFAVIGISLWLHGAIFPAVLLAQEDGGASGEQQSNGGTSGFFGNDMKADGLVEGMDLGRPRKDAQDGNNPVYGNGINSGSDFDYRPRKPPPQALVPEVERSNDYSVPVRTAKPTPTPEPSPTPEPVADSIATPPVPGQKGAVPGPEYYRSLIDQVKNPEILQKPQSENTPEKPKKREQTYRF